MFESRPQRPTVCGSSVRFRSSEHTSRPFAGVVDAAGSLTTVTVFQ